MIDSSTYRICRALVSVSDKTELIPFVRALTEYGIHIISTGGTARELEQGCIPVAHVTDITGQKEILDGRVKTLHPKIHAGLLAMRDNPEHMQQLEAAAIQPIDMLVGNLYPFEQTLGNADATHADIIEHIDIGGPAMIRAAAKNYRWVVVVTSPHQYAEILETLRQYHCCVPEDLRLSLAHQAFLHTALYDSVIAQYLGSIYVQNDRTIEKYRVAQQRESMPQAIALALRKHQDVRYGENPHQRAALYAESGVEYTYDRIVRCIHGKELSYNNMLDIDAAVKLAAEFRTLNTLNKTVVIIKHTNPCGVGSGTTLEEAYKKALACDTTSAFGGIIALTGSLDEKTARLIDELFTEVIIAPHFTPEALELLKQKKNRRLVMVNYDALEAAQRLEMRAIAGGILVQTPDKLLWDEQKLKVVTRRAPTDDERRAMEYAWRIAKHVKSNAVVYAAADRALAIGAGQMSRVDAASIAVHKAETAGISLEGSAVASDAFFPFADGLLEAVKAGATAVIQPGGSVRDNDVIAAANEYSIAMIFTGVRHFRH
ncbi:MAG: bifunctional phosphoribosylaminoimidazolecarboxamide formyltransferase/IMP cyclohydrolase [Bacteroidota bacterium]|nr:bifunctional phosphoribosylaminoimidazolecarboxamide formyltransferase/IMP cyclohydrolase [Candidatus Kapabacteria bacterium]MDW8220407.1 bifunctional phosphoribosylaminoimidazolecarboxamide formyltransferase/IMP cyclohydrolase [Bacteroidota bacterium]